MCGTSDSSTGLLLRSLASWSVYIYIIYIIYIYIYISSCFVAVARPLGLVSCCCIAFCERENRSHEVLRQILSPVMRVNFLLKILRRPRKKRDKFEPRASNFTIRTKKEIGRRVNPASHLVALSFCSSWTAWLGGSPYCHVSGRVLHASCGSQK